MSNPRNEMPRPPAEAGADPLLDLASLHGDAGNCDRLETFLEVAAARARTLVGAREALVLYLGDGARHVAVDSGEQPSDLEPLLQALWQGRTAVASLLAGPFEIEEVLDELRRDLEERAAGLHPQGLHLATLTSGREPVGLVGLLAPEPARLEVYPAPGLGRALSVAIGNFLLFNEARRHLARQSFLREIAGIFATGGDVQEKVQALVVRLQLLRGVHGCALSMYEAATDSWSSRASAGLEPPALERVEALARQVVGRSAPLYLDDLAEPGLGSYLGIPVSRRETLTGVLSVSSRQRSSFNRRDVELLVSVSEQIALNLENALLLEKSREQVEELSFVFRVSATLRREKTIPGIMNAILEQCVRSVAADHGYLMVHEPSPRSHLVPAASWGWGRPLAPDPLPLSAEEAEALLRTRYSEDPEVRFADLFREVAGRGLPEQLERWILIPLRTDRGLLGVLLVGRSGRADLGESQRRLLLTLTNVAENAIGRALAFEETQARVREEAASRAKSEFLAIMSHELRTPLTAILGFAEVLLGEHFGTLNDKQREYLGDILQNGNHLLALINDVLDLAKVEAGRMELALERLDLREVLEELEGSFQAMAHRRGLTLAVHRLPGPRSLQADRRRLKQILYNLVSNALKFTDAPGRVEVRATDTDDRILLAVEDTGVGIAREDLEPIFQPFTQARTTAGKQHEGTGLGLSLTRKLVDMHGGRIWVDSEPGRGSTFYVELPVEAIAE